MSSESMSSRRSSSSEYGSLGRATRDTPWVPQPWKKPRSRIYDYNRALGNEYYRPMVDYVLSKENQGPYHSASPREVHMPVAEDLADNKIGQENLGYTDLNDFLVKSYAKQIKERNQTTANVHRHMLHHSLENTEFSRGNLLSQHARAGEARSRWLGELMVCTRDQEREESERRRRESWERELGSRREEREREERRLADPQVVSYLRGGAQAATMWCHRTPLTKAQRRARLEGKPDWEVEEEVDGSSSSLQQISTSSYCTSLEQQHTAGC